jgi:cytochrome c peroxidase
VSRAGVCLLACALAGAAAYHGSAGRDAAVHPDGPRDAAGAQAYTWSLPRGIPRPVVPRDNPMSRAKVELGRRLFYDRRVSGRGTFACASCHQQRRAFTDGLAHAVGALGHEHRRSTMSLANVAFNASFGWADPGRRTLESQMAIPLFNDDPIEMGLSGREADVVARLAAAPGYSSWFRDAFPDDEAPVTIQNVVKAIAAFERTLVSGDSPFDRYLYRDDRQAMTPAALRGMKLFFSDRLRCAECHASFNLSGPVVHDGGEPVAPSFHNTGLYDVDGRGGYPVLDRGLFDLTRVAADMGRFRAPTLRNVAVTAPYMHDGSVPTLRAAVSHYAAGGRPSLHRSRLVRGFALRAREADDVIAFLEALTDEGFLTDPAFADPEAPPRPDGPK